MATEAGGGDFVLHKIRPGETVSELSRHYGVPVHLIAAWNDLNDISKIRAGHQLVFYVHGKESIGAAGSSVSGPAKKRTPEPTQEIAGNAAAAQKLEGKPAAARDDQQNEAPGRYYTVMEGDSLWKIARKFDLDTKELQRLNGLKTNAIYPGDRILVAASQSTEAEFYYHVRNGDSLWTIAQKYNISPAEIKRWNNIRGSLIHPGNQLLIKLADAEEPMGDTFYQVRSGDSLWTIAKRHNISPEEIKRWNNLQDNTIYPGNRLLLKLARGG